jgi:hypothetical protein
MTISKAIGHFKEYHRTTVKKRTQDGYKKIQEDFQSKFSDHQVDYIKSEELCRFLET